VALRATQKRVQVTYICFKVLLPKHAVSDMKHAVSDMKHAVSDMKHAGVDGWTPWWLWCMT
jgi:hypothetical protein